MFPSQLLMLRPAARHYGVVVGRVCLDSVPWLPCWGHWFSRGRAIGLASLVVLDLFMLRAHGLYGGKVEVVLVARLGWVRMEASEGWITSVRLWVLPEFFWWSCDGSDVALMQLGAKWDGWEVACAVST